MKPGEAETLDEQSKNSAEERGHSLEAELKELLANPVPRDSDGKDFHQIAAEMRKRLAGRKHSDTLELLREDRDR
jgi:hypothetical protein